MFLTRLNAEIVACIYYYSENRDTSRIWKVLPNMFLFSRFFVFFFVLFFFGGGGGGGGWRRSEHVHASYPGLVPGLSFRPLEFSPYMGREERRVQGLD